MSTLPHVANEASLQIAISADWLELDPHKDHLDTSSDPHVLVKNISNNNPIPLPNTNLSSIPLPNPKLLHHTHNPAIPLISNQPHQTLPNVLDLVVLVQQRDVAFDHRVRALQG
jgi:hypothetical protein